MENQIVSIQFNTSTQKNPIVTILDSNGSVWKLTIYEGQQKTKLVEIICPVKISAFIAQKFELFLIGYDGSVQYFNVKQPNRLISSDEYKDLLNVKNIFHNNNFTYILFKDGKIFKSNESNIKHKGKRRVVDVTFFRRKFLDRSKFSELCSVSNVVSIAPNVSSLFLLDDGNVFAYFYKEKNYSFVADNIQKIESDYLLSHDGYLISKHTLERIADDSESSIIDLANWSNDLVVLRSNYELELYKNGKFFPIQTPLASHFYLPQKSARK